jgi:GDP-4-dehydro-6-deoxy-D-mannose reductase
MQEQAAQFYIRHFGLHIVLVRAFNHIGPGQNLGFVIPDFASRIARIEQGKLDRLEVGNLSAQRDFSDVRDIVRGYGLLMEKGRSGEVYNIGSGKPRRISEILQLMLSYSKSDIQVFEDPAKMRPSDAPLIYGDCAKIREDVGYEPKRQIEDTLQEILEDWRRRVTTTGKEIS